MSARRTATWDGLSRRDLQERWGREAVHPYGRVGSTNSVARELAEDGAPSGTIVVAREQTQGRGRHGRRWYSPAGAGVYVSLVLRTGRKPPPSLPVLAGLAVVTSLDRCFEGLHPRLKWPNDVMAADRKLGGLLAEATWSERTSRYLVVGAGINVRPISARAPEEIRERATAVDAVVGRKVALVEVADAVIEGLETYLADPPETLSLSLLEQLDRYDWLRDRRAVVIPPGEETGTGGICVGIAPDGALLFRPDRGALRRVQEGTVEMEA